MKETSVLSKIITPTLSRQFFMMAKEYEDVIDFTLGDPDLPTPEGICEAAYRASLDGHTRYAHNAGHPALREAIAQFENERCCMGFGPSNVAVTMGATEAVYLAFLSVLNPGDEALILAPYWAQYENIVKLIGAKPVIIPCRDDFEPDFEALKKAVCPKTKVLVVNSPNNPSGHIYNERTLKELAYFATSNDLLVFADEVYRGLTFVTDCPTLSTYCPKERLFIFNSFSKQFAMTGWRVGYVLADEYYINTIVKFQQNVAVCVATPNQYAALEALTHADRYSSRIKEVFQRRRDVLKEQLDKVPLINYQFPAGTFYVFIDISATGYDSKSFCFSLLEKEHVAMIPGIAFGEAFDHYVRLAFTLDESRITEGVSRINKFFLSR